MFRRIVAIFSCLVFLPGCMSVAQQALKSEENVLDVSANSEFSAGYAGIYRLSRSSAGAYRLLPLCPDDTREQRAFAAIESFGQKSNATLTDQDAFDYVSISVNPVRARANIDELTTEVGVTFDGIPRSKRVVEGYSVTGQKRAITSADDILDSAYVEGGVAENCSANIADSAKFAWKACLRVRGRQGRQNIHGPCEPPENQRLCRKRGSEKRHC